MSYPASLDSFATKADATDDVLAVDHNAQSAAIVAIETELGLGPRGSFADVKARLDRTDTLGAAMFRAATTAVDSGSTGRTMAGYDNTPFADTGFTAVQGTGLITVPSAGWYGIEAHCRFSANYTGGFTQLTVNDGTNDVIAGPAIQAATASPILELSCSGFVRLAAATVVRARVFTSTTTTLVGNSVGNVYYFRVVRL